MGRELQVICLPFLSFLSHPFFAPLSFPSSCPFFFVLSPTNYSPSGSSHLSRPFSSPFSPVSLLPYSSYLLSTSLLAHNLSLFPHLIPRVHSVKTKIHQRSGGIATDNTAACMCACLLWMDPARREIPDTSSVNRQT